MAEWTQDQSNKFTELYRQLEELPNYGKIKDEINKQLFPSGEALPYKEAESKLLNLISQNSGQGGLESTVKEAIKQNMVSNLIQRISEPLHKIFKTIYDPFGLIYQTK